MTALAVILCVTCQLLMIVGQIFVKRGMNALDGGPPRRAAFARDMFVGITFQAAWFFLWLGLLSRWPLSKIFPFEGLNPMLLAVGAAIFLRERLPLTAWAGVILICTGITLVTQG